MAAFEPSLSPMPERLGPYRLLECLGRGGMGTVYLAEQERPVRRRVALKVINGFSDPATAERFELECQTLARLAHPHVASLFEVGVTETEQPFVAMELVDGDNITTWCDDRGLGLRQRIELFMGVCAGVRHAHEKGILHRDLKPSNILVTEIDGRPVAKVIDFGIARAVDDPLLGKTKRLTLSGQMIGSPIYMSPETILGERDADTRSDVHGLGLVLYELLAGALPFDPDSEALALLLHRIATSDLPEPSRRFADLDPPARARIAEQRGLTESSLGRRLTGDLDAIAGKAIARDREARYSSPADLATDLQHHLEHRPVGARPPVPTYLVGRYLQRHLGFVAAAAALLLTLVAGIVASTREAHRANLEAQRALAAVTQARTEARRAELAQAEAQEVSDFLVGLFEISDPERTPDEPVDARQVFERGVEQLRHELHDQPLARARLLNTVCDIYTKMALFDEAEELALEALELRRAHLGPGDDDLLESVNQLGVVYRRQGRHDEAEPLLRQAVSARETASPQDLPALAQALNNLGNLFWSQDRNEDALAAHRRALHIRQDAPDPDPQLVAESLNNLGVLLRSLKRYEEAEVHLLRGEALFREALGENHPRRAACLNNLGMTEHRLRRWARAESHLSEAVAIWQQAHGDQHPHTLSARINLSRLFATMGRDAENVERLRSLLRDQQSASPVDPLAVASTLRSLGINLGLLGDFEAARQALERSLELYRAQRGDDSAAVLRTRSYLAWLSVRSGRFIEAEKQLRPLLDLWRQRTGEDSTSTARALRDLALALVGQGRDGEAEPLLLRSLQIFRQRQGQQERVARVLIDLGELLARTGRPGEARELLEEAGVLLPEVLPAQHPEAERLRRALDGASP